jgi:CoA-transferase family III
MPFPRASQALSRFTVLDLTRVRSGPTCVQQLADWGANVIEIDGLLEDAGGEQPGGPRQGSDFQNLHRNKRAMTLNLKDPNDPLGCGEHPFANRGSHPEASRCFSLNFRRRRAVEYLALGAFQTI